MQTSIRRRILAVLIAYSLLVPGFAIHSQQDQRGEKKTCLWRVQSENNTVYILGSIHLLRKHDYPLTESIERAFDDVQKLVVEVNVDSLVQESARQLLMKGIYEPGKTLEGSLSKEAYELAKTKTGELGLQIDQLNHFKPWLLAITVVALKLQQLGFDPNQGMDTYLFEKAKKRNKDIDALETMEDQISLFDDIAGDTQELLLLQTLKELDLLESEFDKMVRSWASGDTQALEETMLKSFAEYPDVYRRFVSDRNRNWLPKIESFIGQSENVLVVVGTLHVVGKDGVIELLKGKGYLVEQL